MSEQQQTTQGNSPEMRTPEGTLKDAAQIAAEQKPTQEQQKQTDQTQSTDAKPKNESDKPKTESAQDDASKDKDDKKSLLNKDDKKDEKKDPNAELKGAPEKYEGLKIPEHIDFSGDKQKKAEEVFRKLDLSVAGAQQLIDFHSAELKAAIDAPFNAYQDKRNEWRDQLKNDPEIGPKYDQVKAEFGGVLESIAAESPKKAELVAGFREAMDFTGAGDNPFFVKMFRELSAGRAKGTLVPGGGPSKFGQGNPNQPTNPAHKVFPHLP